MCLNYMGICLWLSVRIVKGEQLIKQLLILCLDFHVKVLQNDRWFNFVRL
jgi:hypothetical protein